MFADLSLCSRSGGAQNAGRITRRRDPRRSARWGMDSVTEWSRLA